MSVNSETVYTFQVPGKRDQGEDHPEKREHGEHPVRWALVEVHSGTVRRLGGWALAKVRAGVALGLKSKYILVAFYLWILTVIHLIGINNKAPDPGAKSDG